MSAFVKRKKRKEEKIMFAWISITFFCDKIETHVSHFLIIYISKLRNCLIDIFVKWNSKCLNCTVLLHNVWH